MGVKFNPSKTAYKTIGNATKGYVKPLKGLAKADKVLGGIGKIAGKAAPWVGAVAGTVEYFKNAPKIKQQWGYLKKERKAAKDSKKKAKSLHKQLVESSADKDYKSRHNNDQKSLNRAKDHNFGFMNKEQRDYKKTYKSKQNKYGYLK